MRAIRILLALSAVFIATSPVAFARTEAFCTMQYQPVCGARQVQCIKAPCYPVYETYGNSCVLGAEGGTFIHEGECTAAETGPVRVEENYVPPTDCVAWFDGCNQCGRGTDGQAFCTEMACEGPAAPGYCTTYKTPPVERPLETEPVSSSTTPEPSPGFFERLWVQVLNWFSWF